MCPDCGKQKMLFETEKKAQGFIKWNAEDIPNGEYLRAYYCPSCCGWHISHKQYQEDYDNRTDRLLGAYERSKMAKLVGTVSHQQSHDGTKQDKAQKNARVIYMDIPEEIRNKCQKSYIRRYLDRYFTDNGIEDKGGLLRGAVYKVYYEDLYNRYHRHEP